MTAIQYRKKPIAVEARRVPPSEDGQSGLDLAAWCGGSVSGTYAEPKIFVPTLEGELVARVGDWIVKGPRGEFWPVKGDIFEETYETVSREPSSSPDLIEVAAQAIRDSNGTPEALEWWRTHPQLIPAHVYAAAVLAVLPPQAGRAAVYREVADRLATDAEQGAKEGFTRIYRRSAAKQVRKWGEELRRMADEAQQTETGA